jgi:hypothetical protein
MTWRFKLILILKLKESEKNMTGKELLEDFNNGYKPIIVFTKTIENLEDQFEENMMAKIVNIEADNDLIKITVDESNYLKINKDFEQPVWIDKHIEFYNKKYSELYERKNIYTFLDNMNELVNFRIIENDENMLRKEYLDLNLDIDYTSWLEKSIIVLRNKNK